jgi:hypothetical protein
MPNNAAAGGPVAPDKPAAAVAIEEERANFKALILANPNHFGNMPELGLPVVKAILQQTTYEELTCIGLHPEGDRLEAVVNIKRSFGFGGGTCTAGSIEHVRFFVQRPGGWHDLGVATFTSHDLPAGGPLPVSYSVDIAMDEARKYCTVENIVEVRAILSWNIEPPAGNPGWAPPWGNVLDAKVQIAPRRPFRIPLGTLIGDKLLTIDPSIAKSLDLQTTLQPAADVVELSYTALKEKYQGKDVPGHRSGFTQAQKLLQKPLSASFLAKLAPPQSQKQGLPKTPVPLAPNPFVIAEAELAADLAGILAGLVKTQGDTTFEQLDCVGYNPETRTLGGVLSIKRNSGYSGDLCDPGSSEYVGFWLFVGGAWQSLGSAQVSVHDLAAVSPGNPVRYAVFRGANLPELLCGDITGLPLRAILSWQTPPTGPDFIPVWGNVVNTHVQPIITDVAPGDQRVRLMRVNRVTVTKIDGTGLAQYSGIAGDCNGDSSPFGGNIYIEGDFTVKSDSYFNPATGDILPGAHPPAYQVFVTKVEPGAVATQLTNPFDIAVFPVNPPPPNPAVTVTQAVQVIGGQSYYLYREGVIQAVNPRTLAVWEASGLAEGAYEIEVKGFVWNGGAYVPMATPSQTQLVYVFNGYPHPELDVHGNTFTAYRPQLTLDIDPPAGDCGDVKAGDHVTGTYSVTDHFFGTLDIGLVPITIGGVPQPAPPVVPSGPTLYPAAGTNGTSGTWTLDTTGMTPCGYTVVLSSWDRALVSDECSGHYNQIGVGFCLRKP